MSIYHQYIELQDKVFKRYIKTQLGVLSGKRLDPYDLSKTLPFILSTPDEKVKYKVIKQEDQEYYEAEGHVPEVEYSKEVLETYSADEDRVFRVLNKALFEKGMLIEFSEKPETVDFTNALTDVDIEKIAKLKNLLQFKKQLQFITSDITLDRLINALIDNDRPNSYLRAVKERKDELTV